ncbi:putative prophage LambdaBa02, lipoprotein [Clostridium botulinum C str. Eklund]|nr:putative prophage LambdaBa02, lipoprotein [Clostridium botulinum C str. Eklund]
MDKEIKDVLSSIQCEIKKMNEKLEHVASVANNGDYTYTSDSDISDDRNQR